MNLLLNRPDYFYEMENICRLFLPAERFVKNQDTVSNSDYAACDFLTENGVTTAHCKLYFQHEFSEITEPCPSLGDKREEEITMARGLYHLFSKRLGFAPQWGILTGVRPGKLYSSLLRELGSHTAAKNYMQHRLLVQEDKIDLCRAAFGAEEKAKNLSSPNAFSLYISIPFCPSRCSYCSFVSHSVEKTAQLVPEYVKLLCLELEEIGKIVQTLGLELRTIYFGGGTPTQLTAAQLDTIMTTIEDHFDCSHVLEYTVEGGRPDTITIEKLKTLKAHGVGRLSINPQTMNDSILNLIGRRHTARQVIEAYELARTIGFSAINMDVIAGLPGDTAEGFLNTLTQLLALSPENLTVHTLSLKRSSFLTTEGKPAAIPDAEAVNFMLSTAKKELTDAGYEPYYFYRQSKMLGNLENIGWTKENKDCLYNIYMMNELHTVLAAGAGGVSRLKAPNDEQIERIFNYKYPYEYKERFATILQRKKGIGEFYEQHPIRTTTVEVK